MRMKFYVAICVLLAVPCFCRAQTQAQSSSQSQQAQATQQSAPQSPAQEAPLRVSGDVMAAKIVHMVSPVYPEMANVAPVSGTVVLHAIIAKDGGVKDLKVVSGPKRLIGAAMDAVKQWTYRPTLHNGQPVEVHTTITVVFTLGGSFGSNSTAPLPVDSDVMATRLVQMTPVIYPQIAVAAHVSGTVVLRAIVSTDGTVRKLIYISGPALLRDAAMRTVRQWRYEPMLLNGQPIEAEATVPVEFNLYDERPFTFKADVHDAGSSHPILKEAVEVPGEGKKQDWSNFIRSFEDRTSQAWLQAIPASAIDKKGQVAIWFVLGDYGVVNGGVLVTHSSGNAAIDSATRVAIRNLSPFHGLPANLQYPVDVRVTFAYDHPHALAPAAEGAQ